MIDLIASSSPGSHSLASSNPVLARSNSQYSSSISRSSVVMSERIMFSTRIRADSSLPCYLGAVRLKLASAGMYP